MKTEKQIKDKIKEHESEIAKDRRIVAEDKSDRTYQLKEGTRQEIVSGIDKAISTLAEMAIIDKAISTLAEMAIPVKELIDQRTKLTEELEGLNQKEGKAKRQKLTEINKELQGWMKRIGEGIQGEGKVTFKGTKSNIRYEIPNNMKALENFRNRIGKTGKLEFSTMTEPTATPIAWTIGRVRQSFPAQRVKQAEDGKFEVSLKNGKKITVDPKAGTIENPDLKSGEVVAGSWQTLDHGGLIRLTEHSDTSTLDHEVYHSGEAIADLSPREIAAAEKKYGDAEGRADAYAKWLGNNRHSDTFFGKIWQTAKRLRDMLFGPRAETAFEKVATGRVWEKAGTAAPKEGTQFSATAEKGEEAKKKATEFIGASKTLLDKAWTRYSEMKESTNYIKAVGRYTGGRQIESFEANRRAKQIIKDISKVNQEGITNFLEAKGDLGVLQDRMSKTKDPALKAGYEAALHLTPEQQEFARAARTHYEQQANLAIKEGIIDHVVENYVNHVQDVNSPFAQKVKSEINAGLLRTNPDLAKQRIFQTLFDSEQAGIKSKDKRIGYLMTAYDESLNEAIKSRSFIKELLNTKASDGRMLAEVSGSGKPIVEGEATKGFLIKPKSKPQDIYDYKPIDHPALRKWKWVANSPMVEADPFVSVDLHPDTIEGVVDKKAPIYMQGDILIHPEAYGHLKNLLGKSAIRENPIGKAILSGSQTIKATLLSFSGFHQVQEGIHALFHKVNPTNTPDIDFEDPVQKAAVEHGLMIYDHSAMQNFAEGSHSPGILNRIPVIGEYMNRYQSYLFQDYIPRLKMAMYKEALGRNMERFKGGKASEDQVMELTARQANAAFGELNYKYLGRNKTLQDVFRLMALAPDFLEARTKFVMQALKPEGRGVKGLWNEQSAALIRGAAGMYAGAVIMNMLFSDDKEPHWDQPFQVVIGGKEYSLRSVPGDLAHLFSDPRSFVYHRLNPLTVRTMVEAVTGRDQYGREKLMGEQFSDLAKTSVPIPIQGKLFKEDTSLIQSALQSIGISSWKHKSPAEKLVVKYSLARMPVGALSSAEREQAKVKRDIRNDYLSGDTAAGNDKLEKARQEGTLSNTEIRALRKIPGENPLLYGFEKLTGEQALEVWAEASEPEKKQLVRLMQRKMANLIHLAPARRKVLYEEFREALNL